MKFEWKDGIVDGSPGRACRQLGMHAHGQVYPVETPDGGYSLPSVTWVSQSICFKCTEQHVGPRSKTYALSTTGGFTPNISTGHGSAAASSSVGESVSILLA